MSTPLERYQHINEAVYLNYLQTVNPEVADWERLIATAIAPSLSDMQRILESDLAKEDNPACKHEYHPNERGDWICELCHRFDPLLTLVNKITVKHRVCKRRAK